jgi:hypothetical protein
VNRTVTHGTVLCARQLLHIFVGQERNVTNHAENIRLQRTKCILVDDRVPGMCAPLLLGVGCIQTFPPFTPLVLIPQCPLQFQFFPVASQLLHYVYGLDTPTRCSRNFICGGPNLSFSFLPGLRSKHECTFSYPAKFTAN